MIDRYAACEMGGHVYVVDPDGVRLAQIPLLPNPTAPSLRGTDERWSIADNLARLLNEESERCRQAGLPIEDLRTAARKVEEITR